MASIAMTLYTRPGCHLCEDMERILLPVAWELGCAVQHVDISCDADLEAQFGQEIPVLFINGRKAFKYRLNERDLRKRLRAER